MVFVSPGKEIDIVLLLVITQVRFYEYSSPGFFPCGGSMSRTCRIRWIPNHSCVWRDTCCNPLPCHVIAISLCTTPLSLPYNIFTSNFDKVYPQQSVPGNPVQGCWVSSPGSQQRGAAEERWSTGARLRFHHSSHHYTRVVNTGTTGGLNRYCCAIIHSGGKHMMRHVEVLGVSYHYPKTVADKKMQTLFLGVHHTVCD